MRLWRNRQTRTFEGRMGNHPGSSPGNRTNRERFKPLFFWLSSAACRAPNLCFMAKPLPIGAVTGRVHRMTPQGGDIRCTRLGEQLYLSYILISPTIAVRQVPVCSGAYLILNICKKSVFISGMGGAVTGTWQRILGEFSKILYINIDIFC